MIASSPSPPPSARSSRWTATGFFAIGSAFVLVMTGIYYLQADLQLASSLRLASSGDLRGEGFMNMLSEDGDSRKLPYSRKKKLQLKSGSERSGEYEPSLITENDPDEEQFISDPSFVSYVNQTDIEDNPLHSTTHQFKCLKDTKELWRERKQRAKNITETYCDGSVLGPHKDITRTVPVVFVIEQKSKDPEERVKLLVLTVNTAAHFNDRVYVLIFGPDMWNLRSLKPFRDNVRVYHYDDPSHPIYKAYLWFDSRIYVHVSSNAYSYEIVCFQRWFGLQKFVELKKIPMAFVIDYDVLLFTNVTREMQLCYRGCTFGATRPTGTFTSYWSSDALRDFVRFIITFYRGHMYMKKPQVSDMLVLNKFVGHFWAKNPEAQACFDEVANVTQWDPRPFPNRRTTFDNMIFRKGQESFYQDPIGLPFLFGVGGYNHYFPLKSLHFQGKQKKEILECVASKNT